MKFLEVHLPNIEVNWVIGCLEYEHTAPQPLRVHLTYTLDKPEYDTLDSTCDYVEVVYAAKAQPAFFHLLESLAVAVAENLLRKFIKMRKITVRIEKLTAFSDGIVPAVEYSASRVV